MARPSSKEQARRMLAILNILQENAKVPLEQFAALLELSVPETERLVSKLSCCGLDDFLLVPIYVEDGMVHITGDLPALNAPLRLSPAEAAALLAALKRADIREDDALGEKLLAAAATPSFDREQLAALRDQNEESGISDTLKKLALAVEERLLCQIEYQKKDDEEVRTRIIEPLQILLEGEAWYLRAWCREVDALRTFKVERIKSIRVAKRRFEPREFEPSWRAMEIEGLPVARIRLARGIDPAALGWPGLTVTDKNPDGSTLLEVPFSGTAWIASEIIAMLGRAEVLEPASLREAVAKQARTLADRL